MPQDQQDPAELADKILEADEFKARLKGPIPLSVDLDIKDKERKLRDEIRSEGLPE